MIITKASVQADGSIRWQAVTSDTSPDNTGESTSLQLFQDWIERVERGAGVDWLPAPRKPFLGVSHYPSLDGFGEAGASDKLYIDGNRFKAGGVSLDGPVAKSLFSTLRHELELVQRGETVDQPIRISAAWWDISHSHGPFIFERKSLTDVCPMCERGEGSKVYLKGQLDHFAATRVPINPRTSLALTERAMTKITRRDDAATIIDEELADEMETKSRLVGKSEASLVVKAKPKMSDEEEDREAEEIAEAKEEADEEETTGTRHGKRKPKGGSYLTDKAFTLADARQVHKLASRLELMALVRRNIADLPAAQQAPALAAAIDELHSEFDQIKEAVEDLYLLQPDYEETEDQPMDYMQTFSDTVADALSGNLGKEQKAATIQTALETLAMSLKAELEGPPPAGDMVAAFKAAIEPMAQQIAQLNARLGMIQQPTIVMPTQKSITTPPVMTNPQSQNQLPVSPITGEQSSLTQMVRRSVGLY